MFQTMQFVAAISAIMLAPESRDPSILLQRPVKTNRNGQFQDSG